MKRKPQPPLNFRFHGTLDLFQLLDVCMEANIPKVEKAMLSAKEASDYLQFIESSNMEKDAFIKIVQYCIGIKGSDISSAYILKVAKYFAQDDILTVEQVEKNCLRNLTGGVRSEERSVFARRVFNKIIQKAQSSTEEKCNRYSQRAHYFIR